MAFTEVTIVQDYDLSGGVNPSGTVTFTPTAPMTNSGVQVPAAPRVAQLRGTGSISIPLTANTDPATLPAGVAYKVVEDINGAKRTYYVEIPHDQGATVTLSGLASVGVAPALNFPAQIITTTDSGAVLRNRRLRLARIENLDVTAGTTATLANLSGQGTVSHIFIAMGATSPAPLLDARLKVTANGADSPHVDIDLGTLTLMHNADYIDAGSADGGAWGCDQMRVEFNNAREQMGYNLNLDIPFHDGIVIELANVTGVTAKIFTQVIYDDATPEQLLLKSSGRTYLNKASLTSSDTWTMLNEPTGSAGTLVWHAICGAGSGPEWLERDVELRFGGESSPSFASTGLEDWFLGSWYFQGRQGYGTAWGAVGVNNSNRASMGMDLRKTYGGIRFTNGLTIILGTESAVGAVSHDMSYVVLYYLDDTTDSGTPDTVPDPPTSVTATPGNAQATVSWSAPGFDGGATITGYTVTATPGGATATTAGLSTPVTGLTNGTAYTFTVHATNSVGNSAESSASSAVTPTAGVIPSDLSGLAAWFDASDATTLWTDTGGTTHATTADAAVARWDDKSGNARNATQATSGNRPLLKLANQNGRNALYLDGVNDALQISIDPSATLTAGFTILAVAKLDDTSSRSWCWLYGDGSSDPTNGGLFLGKHDGTDRIHFGAQNWHSGVDTVTATGFVGAWHQFGQQESDTVRRALLDGTALTDTTNSTSAEVATTLHIGGRVGLGEMWKGPIGELIIYNRVLTPTERGQVESYLRTRWGTP